MADADDDLTSRERPTAAPTAVPGFTNDQSWVLETMIERAVSRGIAAGLRAYQEGNCADHLERTEALEATVFGRAEKGVVGLKERVGAIERDAKRGDWRVYVMWAVVLALLSWLGLAAMQILKDLIEHHWLGF